MKCTNPITLKKENILTGKLIQHVPCGACFNCLMRRRADWTFRVQQELKKATTAYFITLTYSDENLVYGDSEPTISKREFQLFMKRLRIASAKVERMQQSVLLASKGISVPKTGKVSQIALKVPKIKYYAVGEYGGKYGRPHYHLIIFNLPFFGKRVHNNYVVNYKTDELLQSCWDKGHVDVGEVTTSSIHYVTGYLVSAEEEEYIGKERIFSLMSKSLGLGYLTTSMVENHQTRRDFEVTHPGGRKNIMPRYYQDKVYSDADKLLHRIEAVKLSDKKTLEEFDRILRLGENPFQYQLQQAVQNFEVQKRRLTKNQKL